MAEVWGFLPYFPCALLNNSDTSLPHTDLTLFNPVSPQIPYLSLTTQPSHFFPDNPDNIDASDLSDVSDECPLFGGHILPLRNPSFNQCPLDLGLHASSSLLCAGCVSRIASCEHCLCESSAISEELNKPALPLGKLSCRLCLLLNDCHFFTSCTSALSSGKFRFFSTRPYLRATSAGKSVEYPKTLCARR